jgi:hypothetical protein
MFLTIFTALTGFIAPFLPEVLKFFRARQDQQFELQRMEMQFKYAEKEHLLKIQEIDLQAGIDEMRTLHQPMTSFGVQMLDAAKGHAFGKWAIVPAFYLFVILDWLSGMVRPSVTYAFVGFYLLYKWARFQLMADVSDKTFTWAEGVINIWNETDYQILVLVLSFWFGQRVAKAVFGGNASTGRPGS